ncbi:MAG: LamB/YcsF family protein [Hyphomonadaceae bacterium]|nr:LamB/YcsF family protein [Hyphomonadaceae bacterium]
MSKQIDLNADLGEGCSDDAGLLQLVSSCNVACGGHAGDGETMRATVEMARANHVRIGAHPAYPDKVGFGRRELGISDADLRDSLTEQITALRDIAATAGARLSHVKPHGALYHHAESEPVSAALIASVAAECLGTCALVGPPDSAFAVAAAEAGLTFLAEGFADRAYRADGRLVPRSEPGAVLTSDETRIAQALQIAETGTVRAITGETVSVPAQTLCLHGDSPGALISAREIRKALLEAGVSIGMPGDG